jgi:hypothetical protein
MSITATATARTGYRCGRRRVGVPAGLAAEHGGGYDQAFDGTSPVRASDTTAAAARVPEAPFGLPVLAEVPRLASVFHHLATADRAQLAAVAELADLLIGDGDEVERTTGVGLDHWLAAVGRLTRMDRRMLVRTCRLLHRLPTLDTAVRCGRLSFAQLRGVTLALRRSRAELDEQVDRVLAATLDALDGMERPDPDVLARQLADAVDELRPGDLAERERDAAANRFLALQPRLDGTGGRITGELDAAGLALLDAATSPTVQQAVDAGGAGAARADLLLHRLAASWDRPRGSDGPGGSDGSGGSGVIGDPEPGGADVAATFDRGPDDDGDVTDVPVLDRTGCAWWTTLPPPKLVMRLRFESLLDPAVPAELLTSLVGGRLKLTRRAARRLTDERGALLRTVIVDDHGAVIGVGRATRRPPGWLADAELALHDTCSGPGCDRPATTAQHDHATPWWPNRPDEPAGTTDVDNVGPLCDATNRAKEAAGWRVDQRRAGIRTWRHDRSGLVCTTLPSTWRAEGDPRRSGRRDHHEGHHDRYRRRPVGTDPPGHHVPGLAELPRGRPTDPSGDDLPF